MKVIVFQRVILPYRVPFFNELGKRVNLTVAYYMHDKTGEECSFEKIKIPYRKIGPIHFQKGVRRLAKRFDVVVVGTDLHALGYIALPFFPHNNKLLSWSIGFRASHSHPYLVDRKHNILDWITSIVLSKCDANIFYMSQAKLFWQNTNLKQEKFFVAINTVDVANVVSDNENKKNIIFVGSLYKGKGIDSLFKAVSDATKKLKKEFHLDIVGDGPCRNELEQLCDQLGLHDMVTFHGAVFDSRKLADIYSSAICCVSPKQAGLSVCTSMGNGVPFITRHDSITGGEIYNISNGVNGVLYHSDAELTDVILDVVDNPSKYIEMGEKAKEYYDNNATIHHMANGFMNAIEYAVGDVGMQS